MGSYSEDLEKRNEELSEALEETCEFQADFIKKMMEFCSYVQRVSSLINGNMVSIDNELSTKDQSSDHPQWILKEAILNKETIENIHKTSHANSKLVQGLKDKTRDTYDKLLEMYNA